MASFSGLGIGLSFVFGCILMGLVAEIYYMLWVRRRGIRETDSDEAEGEFCCLFCWKKPKISAVSRASNTQEQELSGFNQDLELGVSKDSFLKGYGEDSMESELMRLHNLCGPPRLLFTIKEETKEDLESEDKSRKGSRARSLSDIMIAVETPFLSPLSSPPLKPLALDSYNHHGFNPLFESSTEAELTRIMASASPPPKLKFLRDAEEKLIKRLVQEAEKRALKNGGSVQDSAANPCSFYSNGASEVRDGSFMSFLCRSNETEV